jgi:hypothetical protein
MAALKPAAAFTTDSSPITTKVCPALTCCGLHDQFHERRHAGAVMHNFRQASIIFLLVANSLYAAPKAQESTHGFLIKIEGVQGTYDARSHTNVSVLNESGQDLDINVALESLESGSWVEIAVRFQSKSFVFQDAKAEADQSGLFICFCV